MPKLLGALSGALPIAPGSLLPQGMAPGGPLLATPGRGTWPPGLPLVLILAGLLLLWQLPRLIPALGLRLARLRELASRLRRLLLALLAELTWVDPQRRRARRASRRRRREAGVPRLGWLAPALLDPLRLPLDWLASLSGPRQHPSAASNPAPQAGHAGLSQRLGWVLEAHVNLHLLLSFLRLLAPRLWLPGFLWRQIVRPDSYGPEFPIRRVLWVTHQADVRDVLARAETFAVVYGPRMRLVTLPIEPATEPVDATAVAPDPEAAGEDGNFLLGMQDTPRYWRDISNMRLVFRREDAESCRQLAERTAAAALNAAITAQAGQRAGADSSEPFVVNLVAALVLPVAEALVNDYFGIPVPLRCAAPGAGSDAADRRGAAAGAAAGWNRVAGQAGPGSGSGGDPAAAGGAPGATDASRQPEPGPTEEQRSEPTDAELQVDHQHRWLEVLFQYIFYDIKGEKSREACRRDAPLVRRALQQAIQRRRRQLEAGMRPDAEDVLSRCLRLQRSGTPGMDAETLRINLTGFLVGAMTPLINATCQVIAVLLERPRAMEQARAAAFHHDPARLQACVLEALRFWPGDPVIWRWCLADSWLGSGANRCAVPRGTLVMAWNASAMFDPALLASPWEFRTDRNPGAYLHWGHGQHSCAGAYLNMAVIPGMLGPLLRQMHLQRPAGSSGRPRCEHPNDITFRQFSVALRPVTAASA
ncbi:MAG: cytochrome P450 [Synechococcus sp.]|nr:cytochrome P450 [Synechococcus sp.]